jgi:hypothetical protein
MPKHTKNSRISRRQQRSRKGRSRQAPPDGFVPRTVKNREYQFTRVAPSGSLTLVSASASSGASTTINSAGLYNLATGSGQNQYYFTTSMGFCLADVPTASDFTGLFERWRLNAVEVTFLPMNTSSISSVAGGNGDLGLLLHSVVDYNDRALITASDTGINSMRQRPTYRLIQGTTGKPIRFRIRPRTAIAAYAGGAFTSYVNMAPQWCDATSSSVEHYGLKLCWEVMNPTSVASFINFKLEVKYWLSFTDVY